MKNTILLIIFETLLLTRYGRCNTMCTTEFCSGYLATESCSALPKACTIQNSTHNGQYLPSPGPCNCCTFCVENLDEGEECAKGDPTIPTPTAICGGGLTCVSKNNDAKCEIMNTPCTRAQLAYDQEQNMGQIGELEIRPICDESGLYAHYKCIPGEICYCVSEEGERIFGEIPFTSVPHFLLTCACSRMYNKAVKAANRNLNPSEYFRCAANGDYDTIQCIDDKCFCVDADNGELTYPDLNPINMTSISQTNLKCFNNYTHIEAAYYRVCENFYAEALKKLKLYKERGYDVVGDILPNCQLDGYYAPVQETTTDKYCSDPLGKVLENFKLPKTDPEAASMNCKCARTRYIMVDSEKPQCKTNGNYKQIQERRGSCRCVDENGVQYEKEIECEYMDKLSCYHTA